MIAILSSAGLIRLQITWLQIDCSHGVMYHQVCSTNGGMLIWSPGGGELCLHRVGKGNNKHGEDGSPPRCKTPGLSKKCPRHDAATAQSNCIFWVMTVIFRCFRGLHIERQESCWWDKSPVKTHCPLHLLLLLLNPVYFQHNWFPSIIMCTIKQFCCLGRTFQGSNPS